jgi:hypothetical protein
MKTWTFLLLSCLCLSFLACDKEDSSPTPSTGFDANGKTLLGTANFSSAAHATNGTVKIYSDNTSKYLVLENFKTDKGPDLYIYLSNDLKATNFSNITKLDQYAGSFFFKFDKTVDEKTKDKVLIWCKQFAVLFGSADL